MTVTGGTAVFSPCETYRYSLTREVEPELDAGGAVRPGNVLWIMLNPSTATAEVDDPTIGRIQSFTAAWGYGQAVVGNLFGLRSTDPSALKGHIDPVGEGNNAMLVELAAAADLVMAAWGVHGVLNNRALIVSEVILAHVNLWCLGKTREGRPKHPLYVPAGTERTLWRAAT